MPPSEIETELLELVEATLTYDKAIQECGDSPESMASFCTASGDTLDTLYFAWKAKAELLQRKYDPEKAGQPKTGADELYAIDQAATRLHAAIHNAGLSMSGNMRYCLLTTLDSFMVIVFSNNETLVQAVRNKMDEFAKMAMQIGNKN